MKFYQNMILLLTLLITISSLSIGCNDKDDPDPQPQNNPAKALEAKANILAGYLNLSPTQEIRNQFFTASSALLAEEPGSDESQAILTGMVINTFERIWSAGILDENGVVLSVYPLSRDSIVGDSWASQPGVISAMDTTGFHSDIAEMLENERVSMNYYRSLSSTTEPERIVFTSIAIDSSVSMNAYFLRDDLDHDYSYFILEKDGRIINDLGGEYFGEYLNDSDIFPSDLVTLAERMMIPSDPDKYDDYNFSEAPGANTLDGDRYIGWGYSSLITSTYWIIAVTESIE
jgi:hypothetical protein